MVSNAGIKKYKQFHGKCPHTETVKEVKNFNTLVYLADPEILTYVSNKRNGGGNGKRNYFKHRFSKSTKLYCTPDGKMLVIMGTNLKVTPRGIVG